MFFPRKVSKAVFTRGARVLEPGYRHKIMLRSDTGYSKYPVVSCSHLVREFKLDTLYPGTGTVPEFWCEYFEKGLCSH